MFLIMWTIVCFTVDNSVAVVPNTWITMVYVHGPKKNPT